MSVDSITPEELAAIIEGPRWKPSYDPWRASRGVGAQEFLPVDSDSEAGWMALAVTLFDKVPENFFECLPKPIGDDCPPADIVGNVMVGRAHIPGYGEVSIPRV